MVVAITPVSYTHLDVYKRQLVPHLSPDEAEALIAAGTIAGGMIPKVRAALDALARGVPQVRIVDLAGLRGGGGTVFSEEAGQ